MTDSDMPAAMKQATGHSVALVTAMQGGDAAALDRERVEVVRWIGVVPDAPEAQRLALQLTQSAHLTTLCIELLAKASGMTTEQTTQRLAALIAGYNEQP